MENVLYQKWLEELTKELNLFDDLEISPTQRLNHALPLINDVIKNVKQGVLEKGFTDQESEIYFFKHIKPGFYSLQIWEMLIYHINTQVPFGTKEMIHAFYEQEIRQVMHYLNVNSFHYQYYKSGVSEMDHIYFVRSAEPGSIPIIEFNDPYPGFSTALDYPFAKFIAYERLLNYILELSTDGYGGQKGKTMNGSRPIIRWTGDTINLVEVGYGIWLTGQANNGDAGVAEIIQLLESAFHVNVGRAYRRWQSIGQRKRLSPVKFIDQMRDALIQKIEDANQ